MDKSDFISAIHDFLEFRENVANISNAFKLDFTDSNLYLYSEKLFCNYMLSNFNSEDVDTILWWCYDKQSNPKLKYTVDGKIIPSDTIEDLWNIVGKINNLSKNSIKNIETIISSPLYGSDYDKDIVFLKRFCLDKKYISECIENTKNIIND